VVSLLEQPLELAVRMPSTSCPCKTWRRKRRRRKRKRVVRRVRRVRRPRRPRLWQP
jgi:hypothetical protein